MMRRPRRPRRSARRRPLAQLAGIAAIVLVAGAIGGEVTAWRVYDMLDRALPAGSSEATSSGALVLRGPIERIVDGDTLTLDGRRIRFCGVDAPEMSTPAGDPARRALEDLVGSSPIECRQVGAGTPCDGRSEPMHGNRIVAQCFANGRDLAMELVRAGHVRDVSRFSGGHYVP